MTPLFAVWLATVLSVTDGDTFRARVTVWPGQTIETSIRLVGIDAPELRGQCKAERVRAVAAKTALTTLIQRQDVFLHAMEADKYFGRIVSRVTTRDGVDVAAALEAQGYVVSYDGGKRTNWCQEKKP